MKRIRAFLLLLAASLGQACDVGTTWAGPVFPKVPVPAGGVPGGRPIERASRLVADRKPDEALAVLRQAAGTHPGWPPVRLILARLHSVAGQAPQALRALELAAAEAPDDPRVYQGFATLALAEARF